MIVALWIIAILWIAWGTFMVVNTERARTLLKALFEWKEVKRLGIIPVVFGAFLLLGAFFHEPMIRLAFVLGVVAVLKGMYFFVAPPAQVRRLLDWWFHEARDDTMRLFGLIAFALGSALFSHLF